MNASSPQHMGPLSSTNTYMSENNGPFLRLTVLHTSQDAAYDDDDEAASIERLYLTMTQTVWID